MEITDKAKEELHKILESRKLDDGQGLRLATPPVWEGEGDFGIVIDVSRDRDEVIKYQDREILWLDPGTTEHLDKSKFDFKDGRFNLDIF